MNRRLPLLLPALVLAVVAALALGTGGAASAAGLTTKAVKKIAAKVVQKKAPGLSVAKAKAADTATTAVNAANAANAADAAQLGGLGPASYLDRVSFDNITANTPVAASTVTQIMAPTVIAVPPGVGFIHVTGSASFSTGNTNYVVWPSFDSGCVESGVGYAHRAFGNTTEQSSVPVNMVLPVTAGNHSVRLCVLSAAATSAGVRSIAIRTVAGDFNG